METKLFEVRDDGTCMPIFAIKLVPGNGAEMALLARTGYGNTAKEQAKYIIVGRLEYPKDSAYAAYQHDDGYLRAVHTLVEEHWNELEDGDVIDPKYYAGLRKNPLPSDVANDTVRGLWEAACHAKEKTFK